MKKTTKIKLHIEREVVRALQTKELRLVEGGNAENLPRTGDSKRECCG